MSRRAHGDWLDCRIDADLPASRLDRRKRLANLTPRQSLGAELAAGHRVFLDARHIGKETMTLLVDEECAFAAHRIAHKRHWPARTVEGGRMELHEFEVGEFRPAQAAMAISLSHLQVPSATAEVGC